MGLFQTVREWFMKVFKSEAEKKFRAEIICSTEMEIAQKRWAMIINDNPPWKDAEDGIITINFAKFISYFCAKRYVLISMLRWKAQRERIIYKDA